MRIVLRLTLGFCIYASHKAIDDNSITVHNMVLCLCTGHKDAVGNDISVHTMSLYYVQVIKILMMIVLLFTISFVLIYRSPRC